jgi:hypothetical protein
VLAIRRKGFLLCAGDMAKRQEGVAAQDGFEFSACRGHEEPLVFKYADKRISSTFFFKYATEK